MQHHLWRHDRTGAPPGTLTVILLAVVSALVSLGWTPESTRDRVHARDDTAGTTAVGATVSQESLQALLERKTAGFPGTWGVAVHHLDTGEVALVNADHVFVAASLYKLMVMCQAFVDVANQDLRWDERLTFTEEDAAIDPPNMEWEVGTVASAAAAVDEMIVDSSNSAAATLLRRLGRQRVNALAESYGLRHTAIGRPTTTTTPAEVMMLLERIVDGGIVDQPASRQMIAILERQLRNDRIPRYLPEGLAIAHKTGELDGIRHDAGIVYAPHGPYIVVLMVEDAPDEEAAAEQAAQVSKLIYDYFEGEPQSTAAG